MDARKILCLIFSIFLLKCPVTVANLKTSQIPSAICKIITQIIDENPETRNIFFGTSEVNLTTKMIDVSLECLPKDIPVIITEIMKDDSKFFHQWSKAVFDKSSIVVIFANSIDRVRN